MQGNQDLGPQKLAQHRGFRDFSSGCFQSHTRCEQNETTRANKQNRSTRTLVPGRWQVDQERRFAAVHYVHT